MDSPVQPWFKRVIAAWVFAASTSGYLFIVTAVPLVGLLFGNGFRDPVILSFACFPLAVAGLLFSTCAAFVPSLVAGNKMQFPLNLTLPLVYCGLILLSSQLMANVRPSITLIGEAPRIDQVWERPDFLAAAWAFQTVCLTLTSVLVKRSQELGS